MICALFLACTAFAQNDRGAITGTVQDPGQARVPNAAVLVTNTQTGAEFKTVTTDTGNYSVLSLPAGVYNVSVEAPGFKKELHANIEVQVASTSRVDFSLQVGTTSDTITVSAETSLLKTESGEQSTVITGERINKLPLNFGGGGGNVGGIRSAYAFNILSPGVAGSGNPNGRRENFTVNLVAIQDGAQDAAGLVVFLVVVIELRQGLGSLRNASPLAHHLEGLGMEFTVARAVHHLQQDWMNLAATVKGPVGACCTLDRAVSM
jgi:hypothetical protein